MGYWLVIKRDIKYKYMESVLQGIETDEMEKEDVEGHDPMLDGTTVDEDANWAATPEEVKNSIQKLKNERALELAKLDARELKTNPTSGRKPFVQYLGKEIC